jgi:hypothetical protein
MVKNVEKNKRSYLIDHKLTFCVVKWRRNILELFESCCRSQVLIPLTAHLSVYTSRRLFHVFRALVARRSPVSRVELFHVFRA